MRAFGLVFLFFAGLMLVSCKPSGPSVLKIYVRNNSNQLIQNASLTVVLEPDVVNEFHTTVLTNASGYALVDLEPLFNQYPDDITERVADFRVYVTGPNGLQTTQKLKARAHMTSVHTIFLVP
jgi:hypothetical protein